MKLKKIWLAAWLLAAMTASAEEAADTGHQSEQTTTERWLEMQRTGQVASTQPQPLSGPAMERAHQRYLQGFEHPLPMYFEHAESTLK